MTHVLVTLADPAAVSEHAAESIVAAAAEAIAARGVFTIALSGGTTPKLLYETLARRTNAPRRAEPTPVTGGSDATLAGIDWSKVLVFFSDERAVPATDPASNHHMAQATVLSRVPIPAENVFRIPADDGDHVRAAADYSATLRRVLGDEAVMDLVLLGMGEDGHVASLFPGEGGAAKTLSFGTAVRSDRIADLAVATEAGPGSTPLERVSISYDVIARARKVMVLVTGSSKAARLAEALAARGALPIQRVLHDRPGLTLVIADRPASARLPSRVQSSPNVAAATLMGLVQEASSASVPATSEAPTVLADIGLVGLGVMGENLALNIEEKGFRIAVFNRSLDKVDDFVAQARGKKVIGARSLKELAASIARPRRIVIMVKAGAAVDATIAGLVPHLEAGDVVIDGGNELFTNTERRGKELADLGLDFVGMGVSGGEEGARHGPSLMPGCTRAAYAKIEDVVTKIAAQVADGPCVTHVGPGGAGHYVKMVHNGIEYGDMQLIAEAYDVLRTVGGLSNDELASTFAEWNRGELESFLIEITAQIFTKKDDLTGQALVDVILDTAQMKGTGSWTVKEGADLAQSIPTIASAVDARVTSASWALRQRGAALLEGPEPTERGRAADPAELVRDVRAALYAAKACSYAQGMALLAKASATYGWGLDLGEIARIWKGGCIIRAAFLGRIQAAFGRNSTLENLLFDADFVEELAARQDGWRRTITRAITAGLAVPAMTASLAYYDGLRRQRTPANLTQAQRDLFGAHTYQRTDRNGVFHTDWT